MAVSVCARDMSLVSAPIRSDWVLEGRPEARNAVVARSADRTTLTMVWDCTAGRFRWIYDQDESVQIMEGGAVLTFPDGRMEAVGPGDIVFFPAGTSATWEVKTYVRKFAVFRHTVPRPLGLAVKAWSRLRQASSVRSGRCSLASPAAFAPQLA